MDQPDLPTVEHQFALKSLARINWVSRGASILAPSIWMAAQAVNGDRPLRVLDLACGGGDVLTTLARQAQRRRLPVDWFGCDRSETAIGLARRQAADAKVTIDFSCRDVLRDALPRDCDVVMCSLFLHHLTDEQAVCLLTRMRSVAGDMVLVNDLIRSRWGYWLAQFGCRALTRSAVVHYDGPVSVGGAYTIEEAGRLAERAGLDGAVFSRHWPQRYLLKWSRT